jgi:predicted dithiol-disulfide oxidoreductase (DUF899 family)
MVQQHERSCDWEQRSQASVQNRGSAMPTQSVRISKVVPESEWLEARKKLLKKEKALTRQRDEVSRERRAMPWVKVEKNYVFETPQGQRSLGDLFEGRSQLIVYHFMWRKDLDNGCVGCSFLADHLEGVMLHIPHNDVSFVVCSRAPLATLDAYKRRMGWKFPWVSSDGSDFNFDFHVSFTKEQLASGKVYYNYETVDASIEELSGTSVFYKDERGQVFHTYSTYGRGNEEALGTYMYLDLVPKGRNENGPHFSLADWVRQHDKYDDGGRVDRTGGYIAPAGTSNCCPKQS